MTSITRSLQMDSPEGPFELDSVVKTGRSGSIEIIPSSLLAPSKHSQKRSFGQSCSPRLSRLSGLAARICQSTKESMRSAKPKEQEPAGAKSGGRTPPEFEIFDFDSSDRQAESNSPKTDKRFDRQTATSGQTAGKKPVIALQRQEENKNSFCPAKMPMPRGGLCTLNADVYTLERLPDSDLRGKIANTILKSYVEFKWQSAEKLRVNADMLAKRCADYFWDELKALSSVDKLSWGQYQSTRSSVVCKLISEVQNAKWLLVEVQERLEIMRSALQQQLQLLGCQTDWSLQLCGFLDQLLSLELPENDMEGLFPESYLEKFIKSVAELIEMSKGEGELAVESQASLKLILQAFGDSPEEAAAVLAFLQKWAPGFEAAPAFFKEISEQVHQIAQTVYPKEVREIFELFTSDPVELNQ